MINDLPMLGDQHLTAEEHDRILTNLREYLTLHPHSTIRRRRRLRYGVTALAIIGVLGGGTAAAVAVLQPAPVTDHNTARCYQEISTNFGDDFPGITVAEAVAGDSSTDGQVYAPISVCAATWEAGAFPVRDYRAEPPTDAPYPVPPLVGCVLPDGTAGVFPGTEADCGRMGLAVALPG